MRVSRVTAVCNTVCVKPLEPKLSRDPPHTHTHSRFVGVCRPRTVLSMIFTGCVWLIHYKCSPERCVAVQSLWVQVPDGPDGQTAELRSGDMMVIKYTTVARLVQSGQVTLL